MKQCFLLLLLACLFLSGCPIGGYSYSWWNGATYTNEYKREHIANDGTYLKNRHKKEWYEKLPQEQKNLYHKSKTICGEKYSGNVNDSEEVTKQKNELADKCATKLNAPQYFNPDTNNWEY